MASWINFNLHHKIYFNCIKTNDQILVNAYFFLQFIRNKFSNQPHSWSINMESVFSAYIRETAIVSNCVKFCVKHFTQVIFNFIYIKISCQKRKRVYREENKKGKPISAWYMVCVVGVVLHSCIEITKFISFILKLYMMHIF